MKSIELVQSRQFRSSRGDSRPRTIGSLVAAPAFVVVVALGCAGASAAGEPAVPAAIGAGAAVAAAPPMAGGPRGDVIPPDIAAVERMCALLTSCDRLPIPPSLIPDDFASCVKKMSDDLTSATGINFSLTLRECGLQSATCDALRTCALHGANADSCTGRGKTGVVGFCDADGRALTCWHEQMLSVRDCPRGGEQCLIAGGQATCSLGACPATFAEGDKPRCSASGTRLLHCDKGKLASLDCAAFGLKCAASADGTAGCATVGPACTSAPAVPPPGPTPVPTPPAPLSAAPSRCEGNVAVGCVNGHEVRVNCASAGLVCSTGSSAPGSSPVGSCVAPPPPTGGCDPNDRARCDEGVIKYCAAGRPRQFVCKGAGFTRCEGSKTGLRCAP